jgi:hypothetical protein
LTELLFREDPYLAACEARVVAVREGAVELDRTIFYPLGGGQTGDTGRIGEWRVVDTRAIDWDKRHRHMRFHTALHLLCAVVKAPVTGGRMAADKAHLDFDVEMDRLVQVGGSASRRGPRASAGDCGRRPSGLRRHARAQHRGDRHRSRGAHPVRGEAKQARDTRAAVSPAGNTASCNPLRTCL